VGMKAKRWFRDGSGGGVGFVFTGGVQVRVRFGEACLRTANLGGPSGWHRRRWGEPTVSRYIRNGRRGL
jgi:hypothetical protein